MSSDSMVIPNGVSVVLDVICIPSIDTTSEHLVLSNGDAYLDWISYDYYQTN